MNRREQIVAFVRQFWAENGYAPTLSEIGQGVGLASNSSVANYLYELRENGTLAYADGRARTVRLV